MIGSCGRPDLVGSIGHTADQMARLMYNSLWKKLAVLPDSVHVSFNFCLFILIAIQGKMHTLWQANA